MGWFKKLFFNEEHREEQHDEKVEEALKDELEEALKGIAKTITDLKKDLSTSLAYANTGAQKYGRPTMWYKGKKYNSSLLIREMEHKTFLTIDELTACKTMKILLEEQMKELGLVDEYGNQILLFEIEDEVLKNYGHYTRGHILMLNNIITKAES